MHRFKVTSAIVACLMLIGVSPALAQTNTTTGTANGSTTSQTTQVSVVNIVSNITGGSLGGVPGGGGGFGGGLGGGFGGGGLGGGVGTQQGFALDGPEGIEVSGKGAAAGNTDGKLAVWIRGSYATFDQDQTQIQSDGDTYTVGGGGDWRFSDRVIGGLSLSYYQSDTKLGFNNGNMDTDGYVVAPYFAAILGPNRNFLWDGTIGYGQSSNDVDRNFGAITGSFDSETWFAATNLSYLFQRGNFAITPKVGVLWLDSTNDAYTESGVGGVTVPESDSQLGRLSAGGTIAYTRNPRFVPYVSLIGEYDFETDDYSAFAAGNRPSVEDTGATVGVGASMSLSERTSATMEATTALGRDDYESYTVSGTLRFAF